MIDQTRRKHSSRLRFLAPAAFAAALLASVAATPAEAQAPRRPTDCAALTALRLPDVRILVATEIRPAPVWKSPDIRANQPGADVSVPFCRVQGRIEDEIDFELWLPATGAWNGRFLGLGNGGFAGFFRYDGLARGLSSGFATVSTDTGHKVTEKNWPIGHPRRLENLGHRGQHLVAVNAQKIVAAFYGTRAHHNYFVGCSGGGMQAMNEVQRYPSDYDGIVAGAHGRSIIGISARWLTSALIARSRPGDTLSTADWKAVAAAAVAKCDPKDGIRDGIIADPRRCRFDVAETPGLTPAKVEIARSLLGPVLGHGGRILFPGFAPGVAYEPLSEPGRAGEAFALWYYGDPDWDFSQFDAARDLPLAEAAVPGASFTNPNLEAFARRGGKLISHHGWTDEILPAQATIDYHDSVVRYMGRAETDGFYRLFLAPGVDHCGGGAGPDNYGFSSQGYRDPPAAPGPEHDVLQAIIAWVEQGRAPDRIIASKVVDGRVTMSRPLCPYPSEAIYKGKGDTNDAASFTCGRKGSR